jgi:hypothetical protein
MTHPGTYGDSGRGILRRPGPFNIDASLIENTRFGRYTIEWSRRNHFRDAVEPGLRALRHDRAPGADRSQGKILSDGDVTLIVVGAR